jgi:hypothetical protein
MHTDARTPLKASRYTCFCNMLMCISDVRQAPDSSATGAQSEAKAHLPKFS